MDRSETDEAAGPFPALKIRRVLDGGRRHAGAPQLYENRLLITIPYLNPYLFKAAVTSSRIEALERMLATRPSDHRARFGLALELERLERWEEVVHHLREYLAGTDDEGNAYGRLARALLRLDRPTEAQEAYRQGIEAANRHGHPSLAAELEEEMEGL